MGELRGPEFVRGYEAAMKYAAEFVRDAGVGTPIKDAFDIIADHLDEKSAATKAAAAAEAKLVEAMKHVGPPSGYFKLPVGVRCRCVKLWTNGVDHFCCKGATSDH